MRRAMSLLELIFVLVIMGILAKVGFEAFKNDHLQNDANFIMLAIKKSQFEGIGFDHRRVGGGEIANGRGCLTLDKDSLESKASEGGVAYRIHVELLGDLANKTICFDHKGAPHFDNYHTPIDRSYTLRLKEGSREGVITLFPRSGYIMLQF